MFRYKPFCEPRAICVQRRMTSSSVFPYKALCEPYAICVQRRTTSSSVFRYTVACRSLDSTSCWRWLRNETWSKVVFIVVVKGYCFTTWKQLFPLQAEVRDFFVLKIIMTELLLMNSLTFCQYLFYLKTYFCQSLISVLYLTFCFWLHMVLMLKLYMLFIILSAYSQTKNKRNSLMWNNFLKAFWNDYQPI